MDFNSLFPFDYSLLPHLEPSPQGDFVFRPTEIKIEEVAQEIIGVKQEPKNRRIFSKTSDKFIVERIEEGWNFNLIAKALGLKNCQVRKRWYKPLSKQNPNVTYCPIFNNRGISKFTSEENLYIFNGIENGKSYEEIAEEMSLSCRKITLQWTKYLSAKHPNIHYNPHED